MNPRLKVKHPSIFCIYGKSGSGKSNLIKYLIYYFAQKKKIDFIYVFSGSSFNNFYQKFLNDNQVSQFTDEKLGRLLRALSKKKERGEDFKTLLVLDDIAGTSFKKQNILKLINNFRHFNLTLLLATQYPCLIPPNLRSNCTKAFIFKHTAKRDLTALYESYFMPYYNKLDDFIKFMKKSENYKTILVDPNQLEFKDSIKYFKAPLMN